MYHIPFGGPVLGTSLAISTFLMSTSDKTSRHKSDSDGGHRSLGGSWQHIACMQMQHCQASTLEVLHPEEPSLFEYHPHYPCAREVEHWDYGHLHSYFSKSSLGHICLTLHSHLHNCQQAANQVHDHYIPQVLVVPVQLP